MAHGLQELARDLGETAAVAEAVFLTAGVTPSGYRAREATLRGRPAPVAVRLRGDGGAA
jgi:hypothetical protein